MKAYILRTGRKIAPFDRPVSEMPVHNQTLAEAQQRALHSLKLSVHWIEELSEIDSFPSLLISDDLYITEYALRSFYKLARRRPDINTRAALLKSPLTEHSSTAFQGEMVTEPDGHEHRAYCCYYLARCDLGTPLVDQAAILPVPHHVGKIRMRANRRFVPSGRYDVPVSLAFALPIKHWSCLVTANMMGMPSYFLQVVRARPGATLALPIRIVWRAGSLKPGHLAGKTYLAGSRPRVHPSAYVEATIIGRRVRIGPNAVVRNSVLDDNVEIRAGAVVEGCTLGKRVLVESNSVNRGCVAHEGAALSAGFVQLSVFGKDAVMCPLSGISDYTFFGSVPVWVDGRQVRSGSKFLGGCLGDNVFMGAATEMNAGRELPNDCAIIKHPSELLSNVDEGVPATLLRIDKGRKKTGPSSANSARRKSA